MRNNSLVSIIIPVYNVEDCIKDTIVSVINQSYKKIEIILVDDGSSDSSVSICNYYSNHYNNIKLIHQENSGVSAARNTGIKNASGEYICFVDGDDLVDPNMVEYLVSIIGDNDISIAGIRYKIKNEEKNVSIRYYNSFESLKDLYRFNLISYSSCAKLYKSSIVKKIMFDEKTGILEDYLFVCNYLCLIDKVSVSSHSVYYYVTRNNSAIHKPFTPKRLEMIYSYNKSLELLRKYHPEIIPFVYPIYENELIEIYIALKNNPKFKNELRIVKREIDSISDLRKYYNLKLLIKKIIFSISPSLYSAIFLFFRKVKN